MHQPESITEKKNTPTIPHGPKGLSLFRSLPRLAKDPFGFCMNTMARGDGMVRLGFGPTSAYLVSHPDYVHHILIDNAANYIKGSIMDGIRMALGNGLFTAEGTHWRRQRRLMQPVFHAQQVEKMSTIVHEAVQKSQERWDRFAHDGKPLDMMTDATHINIHIVLKSLLGTTVDPDQSKKLLELTNAVFHGMTQRVWTFFVPSWVPTPGQAAYKQVVAELDKEIYEIISRRRHDKTNGDDLLGILLDVQDEETGERMTGQQIRDEVFTIFLAGYESTASAVTWASYLLSQHDKIAEQLFTEASEVLNDRVPTYADLKKLPYARQVLNETLRLYPAFPMYFRTSVEDDVVGEYTLRGGSTVIISPYATHRDPLYWDNPETFDPDRFSQDRFDSKARRAYYPFGKGQRICIGQDLSLATALIMLVTLVQKYKLSLAPGTKVTRRYAMTYQPHLSLVLSHRQ